MKRQMSPHRHEPTEAEIQHRAYFLWEEAGRPAGRDLEFWLTAREWLAHHVHVPGTPSHASAPPAEAELSGV